MKSKMATLPLFGIDILIMVSRTMIVVTRMAKNVPLMEWLYFSEKYEIKMAALVAIYCPAYQIDKIARNFSLGQESPDILLS